MENELLIENLGGVKMVEQNKQEEMEEIFNNLTEENKNILNLVAKGMEIAQEKGEK